MAVFTGLSTSKMFTASNIGEDVSPTIAFLAPRVTPFLNWLGDSDVFAQSTKHEFLEEELRPNYLTTGSAIASATADTGITLSDFGDLLTVGTLLENESAAPELMRVVSVVGAASVLVARNVDGAGVGSLASASRLFVRGAAGREGDDHPNYDVTRPRRRKTTTVGLFHIPIAISGTQLAIGGLNVPDELAHQEQARFAEALRDLEKEIIRGTAINSTMNASTYRGIRGLRAEVTSINSTVTASSFAADPHLYLGNIAKQAFDAGAEPTEEWGIVAGTNLYADISNMNDAKIEDTSEVEAFKRVIRTYEGPFGRAVIVPSRWVNTNELFLVPRNRVKPFPLQGRSWHLQTMGKTGDSEKKLLVGEYGVEIHHAYAMARLRAV